MFPILYGIKDSFSRRILWRGQGKSFIAQDGRLCKRAFGYELLGEESVSLHVIVIGGGPGGYTAAFAAAKAGARVSLVESGLLGGVCLNHGCIPTKTLKASADALETAKRLKEFGIEGLGEAVPNMAAILSRKMKVVETLRSGLLRTCQRLKVELLHGHCEMVEPHRVRVHQEEGSVLEISCDKIIIATGTKPLEPTFLTIDHKKILSSDDILELREIPERLLILGGGVVGAEFAFIFQALGSRVTLVEGKDRILPLPSVDHDLSKLLQREMKKRGIACELCRLVTDVESLESGALEITLGPSPFVDVIPSSAKEKKILEADLLLSAIGRAPNTEGLGLEKLGIARDANGWILADEHCETNVPGIYAIGDILGPEKIMLAHVAVMEGLVAAAHCMGRQEIMDYSIVPSAIFTSPEIGVVGLSEAEAVKSGKKVLCPQTHFRELGKAQAMGELAGLFKLVIEEESGKILGAHFAGAHASDLIAEITLGMKLGAKAEDIAKTIHAHPTLAEGIFETIRVLD